ncbi:palmitoyl-monogalactosyldiacylglycerol delta-7 desaturase, chloroplastic-like [Bidens hawaiensis]|uniref:palmitoyl-monogalactosyldiacylglycerol delta-7 desaturase, chloroplastic-like n=1 Tax=Bidens hawaiensis TaxID=980011 RepID=UPI00404A369C
MKWMLNTDEILKTCGEHKIVDDLEKQVFYKFLQKTSPLHTLALALILYALGGVPFVVWGMGVRAVCLFHVTCLVNSICHRHGQQPWITNDLSRNIWWVAILSFGEGWHNNHHAFQYSARFGLKWWQMDIAWYTVRFLETIGLATDVKLPIPTDIQRRTCSYSQTSFESLNPTPIGAKSVIAPHQVN